MKALLPLFVLLIGCGTESSPASLDTSTPPVSLCATDSRVQPYVAGVDGKAKDGKVRVRFVDANPAPPAKGDNAWTVDVLDVSGRPLDGAAVTLKPFMPDHNHGSSIKPQIAPEGTPGRYKLTNVNLFMPGVWQFTFGIEAPGLSDTVVLTFCVDG